MRSLHFYSLVIAAGLLLALSSCRRNLVTDIPAAVQGNDLTSTKLGNERANPYSFQVIKKAIEQVKKQKAEARKQARDVNPNFVLTPDPCDGGGGGGPVIVPTHNYVRFAPQNVDHLTELENSGFELFDVPLNYEVIEDGDFYQDPSIPADQITYQYTLAPYGYPLPPNIPYTVLDQVFLFNEEDGEEQEPDPWSGGGGGDGHCEEEQPNFVTVCDYIEEFGDPVINATQLLIDECLEPYEVYLAAAEISGFTEDEAPEGGNNTASRRNRFRPAGILQVFNTDINQPEPLKGVTVKSRNFMKLGTATTGADGRFFIDKPYRRKAQVIVKFKNSRATTRGINGVLKAWQYAFPVKHKLGRFYNEGLQNINFTFAREAAPHTETARKWVAATAMNAVWDIDQFNQQNNITPFPRLKIWLSSRLTSAASAPMLNYVLAPGIGSAEAQVEYATVNAIIDGLLALVPYAGQALQVLKRVIELNKPDITLRYGGGDTGDTRRSRDIYNTLQHEFSHAAHYWALVQQQPIGGGSQYWWNNIKYTIANGGYGQRTDNGAERVALIEAWAYFAGNSATALKYGNGVFTVNANAIIIRNEEIRQLENHRPNNTLAVGLLTRGTVNERYEGWIPMGLLQDLTDAGETNPAASQVADDVNGYTVNGLFRPLRFSNNTMQEYRQQLLLLNGNLQAAQVNNLVTRYGY